jgi:hypothetical protein
LWRFLLGGRGWWQYRCCLGKSGSFESDALWLMTLIRLWL